MALLPQRAALLVPITGAGLLVRLLFISQPFVDDWSWRESDVAMIARNFYLNGFQVFYPQVDWAGTSPGYVGTEFPLVPFVASLLYLFFGVQDWIGRSVSVLFYALSVPFLFLLVKQNFNVRSALISVGIYSTTPLSIFASRSFMPDTASLTFSLMALSSFQQSLSQPRNKALFALAAGATALAILLKPPALLIGLPFLYLAWQRYGLRLLLCRQLWLFALVALTPPLVWYLHAYSLSQSNPPFHFFGEQGLGLLSPAGYLLILSRISEQGLTTPVAVTTLLGLVVALRRPASRVFEWWLVGLLPFFILAGPGNIMHAWYQLPALPAASAFSGLACDTVGSYLTRLRVAKLLTPLIALAFVASLAAMSYASVKPLYDPWATPLLEAGRRLDRIAARDALVVFADDGNPAGIYYSARKGWHFPQHHGLFWGYPADSSDAIVGLTALVQDGARYLVFTSYSSWYLEDYDEFGKHVNSHYERVASNADYLIFDLGAAPR